jgi:hypothetical protein
MKLTHLLFICLFIICSISAATAQDIIKMKDSSEIKAKVEKVTPTDITYKKADNLTGPEFVVYRQDVESITYENGQKEMMDNGAYNIPAQKQHHSWNSYPCGKNIFSIAILQATEESEGDGDGAGGTFPGFGIHYERMLNKKQNFSLYLPATLSIYSVYNDGLYSSNQSTHAFLYIFPGVKFYPTGSNRRISYSIGPSIALGFGKKYAYGNTSTYDSATYTYNYAYESKSVFKAGLMINNGINIMAAKHLYIGVELGIGFTIYSNDYDYNDDFSIQDNSNHAGQPIVQFNTKVGYRF